jgi:ADP-ribosyl-[dinitrogen reductase] hydrolase
MKRLQSKIAGSVYGFAIGDAMGATTEFMHPHEIKAKYGKVTEIIGGGWLMLKPGEVTDDTQMTMCVMGAVMKAHESETFDWPTFGKFCSDNFIEWYLNEPKDIGSQCRKGITSLMNNEEQPHDKNALGNGSLMRAMPLALMGPEFEDWNTYQGRFTHNNLKCSRMILDYSRLIQSYLNGEIYIPKENVTRGILEPTGHVWNTYNNAVYWSNKDSFKEAIVGAVNNGGDADTIAAITGSIAGVRFGIEEIPEKWLNAIDPEVKIFLKKFINFVISYVQI